MRKSLGLLLIAAALGAGSTIAEGQPLAKVPRIGFLHPGSPSSGASVVEVFRQGLRDFGWIEGQNIIFEYRYARGKRRRLPDLAAELVLLEVDVIVTGGTVHVRAAKQATVTIPIVFWGAANPVGKGLVASLAHPGGNVTGVSVSLPGLVMKRLELLKEAVPKVSRVAMLYNPTFSSTVGLVRRVQKVAPALGLTLQPLKVRARNDFRHAFSAMTRERADALLTFDPFAYQHRKRILQFAAKTGLPVISERRQFAEDGGLLTYGPNRLETRRRAAYYVHRILRGAKPGDLPVERPTKFELVINLKTAKQLGLTIPPEILLRATKVIK